MISPKGSGIGRETAIAFASAGAKQLILLGRNEGTLAETKDLLPPNRADCSVHAVSVTDEEGLKEVAAAVGTWDVLVLNAAFISTPASVSESAVDDWWQSFEVRSPSSLFRTTPNPLT